MVSSGPDTDRRLFYIAATAYDMSRRLTENRAYYAGLRVQSLADDVAWLARALADIADTLDPDRR